MLSVRIITVDHYMCAPIPELDVTYSDFRSSPVKQVPVIRIFGTSEYGEKTCVHIHNVFPYICVPYDGSECPSKLSYQLAASLDKAINIALGYSGANTQHVFKVVLVSGIPFYGFHRKKHQFFKIYFYKPSVVKQAVTLLQNGAVLNRMFQPYEAHIPFILQFFIDFNLHGMSFIKFQEVRVRKANHPDFLDRFPDHMFISSDIAPAVSVSHLEVDAIASHILNRISHSVDGRLANPGLAGIWEDERKRRSAGSGSPIATPPLHSQRPPLTPTSSDLGHRMRLAETLALYSGSTDDSILSGEIAPKLSMVFPIVAPNHNNLDASFVAIHHNPAATGSDSEVDQDITVVDENIAANLSFSQRCLSQSLNRSVVLDPDDLELLDVLENLADAETSVVDKNSILGSQMAQSSIAASRAPAGEVNESDEEVDWTVEVLSPEDEVKRLLDMTMPDIDKLNLTQMFSKVVEQEPGPSGFNSQILKVPEPTATQSDDSPDTSSDVGGDKIPQVDGADDILGKSKRKSLGIRNAVKKKNSKKPTNRENIRLTECTENLQKEDCDLLSGEQCVSSNPACVVQSTSSSSPQIPSVHSCQENLTNGSIGCESPAIHFIQNDEKVILFSKDVCQEDCCKGLLDANDNQTQSTSSLPIDTVCFEQTEQFLSQGFQLLSLPDTLDSKHMFEQSFLEDIEATNGVIPSVECCPAAELDTTGYVEENREQNESIDPTENNKQGISNCDRDDDNDSVLMGDPSMYQQSVYEPEWLADLISEEVRKANSESGVNIDSYNASPLLQTSLNSSMKRRSTRLANKSRNLSSTSSAAELNPLGLETAACVSINKPENLLDTSSSWSPCSCHDISDIPGFSASAYLESLESSYPFSADGTTIDLEMRRLSGALQDGQMDLILQSDTKESLCVSVLPSTSRREELMSALKIQGKECQGNCSKAKRKKKLAQLNQFDPVTDECLYRGRKPLPGPPRFPLNKGKDMHLAEKYYKKPFKSLGSRKIEVSNFSSLESSTVLSRRTHKKVSRQKRKMKLSLTYRKKSQQDVHFSDNYEGLSPIKINKETSSRTNTTTTSSLGCCYVLLDRLTRENINVVCKMAKVKLHDKTLFGIRKGRPPLSAKIQEDSCGMLLQQESRQQSSSLVKLSKPPRRESLSKKRCASWNGTDFKQAKKRARGGRKTKSGKGVQQESQCQITSEEIMCETPNNPSDVCAPACIAVEITREGLTTSRATLDHEICEGFQEEIQDLEETRKNDDSGVETNGEGTSPHIVCYNEVLKDHVRKTSPLTKEEDTCITICIDTNDSLKLSESDSDESVSKPGEELLGSLEVCVSELPKFPSNKDNKVNPKSIICVDGATGESSSSDASGESHVGCQDTQSEVFSSAEQVQIDFPVRESHWFTQQFQPWISLWSPGDSPSHSIEMFSPPRPDTPDNVDVSFQHSAGHSCIDNSSLLDDASDLDCIGPTPPSPSGGPLSSFSISKSLSSINMDDGRLNHKEVTFNPADADVRRVQSATTSQDRSISDIFSGNKSFDSGESKLCFGKLLDLGLSPSHSCIDTENMYEETPVDSDEDFNVTVRGVKPSLYLGSQCSKGSADSVDFQCGQRQSLYSLTSEQPRKLFDRKYSNLFTPVTLPPSPQEILESLSTHNIPEVVNQTPYCSIHSDVGKKIEVGGNVLDLVSHKCVHLDSFKSNIHDLIGFNKQQQSLFKQVWALTQVDGDMNQLLLSHASDRAVLIAPLLKPPSVTDVVLWETARKIVRDRQKPDSLLEVPVPHLVNDHRVDADLSADISNHSVPASPIQRVKASTPTTSIAGVSPARLSPVLTPILHSKFQNNHKFRKSRKSLGKSFGGCMNQTSLPVICESEDGAQLIAVPITPEQTCHGQVDTSLQRLLLNSQFQKQALSPNVRYAPDASACQIKGPGKSSPGFKLVLENLQDARVNVEHQYTTMMSLELHICTCGALRPDPERDPIRAVFYCIANDVPDSSSQPAHISGVIVINGDECGGLSLSKSGMDCNATYVLDEKSLLEETVALVRQCDPDIMTGFEIEMLSWGFLIQRAHTLGLNINQELSRVPSQKLGSTSDEDLEDNNGLCAPKLPGRILLDVWRLLRSELTLQSYTFENVLYHVLHQRISHHSFEVLSKWWEHPSHLYRWMTVEYYQTRVAGVIRILEQLDLIGRTSELARLFGIQFFEVLSRGSQFRVESMMLRLAKPQNYVALSPSVQQRAQMRAPEFIPLIMEPESRFYSDPLIVLDFQSLYPSIIIAYNYCFSTCLGRAAFLGKSSSFEFGCGNLQVPKSYLNNIKDSLSFSPCGVAFVSASVRRGILPTMLEEILEARLAVKQSMKLHKDDHVLQRVLHARQLGLKLIANVTYGYTSANFSGRMPCIEVGDSVVSKGRETLERAIALVNGNKNWGARVVYGDTDSLFVLVPGKSRQEAFRVGAEIAEAVTQSNPSPIKLKLEKVYQPSILQTKKRYVGYMYESPDQKDPVYEAKGIETVRRDGCPAVAKILEQSLRLLFEKQDVSLVKRYVCHQFSKIVSGRANIQDLIFAREYRGMANYSPGACVPALELTKKWLKTDRRAEPRIGERVPYIVVHGPPGQALIHLVRHPHDFLSDRSLRYNAEYYITRAIIPPLNRCFALLGANVLSWFVQMPRLQHLSLPAPISSGVKKTISQYFSTLECACCGNLTHRGVCSKCCSRPQVLVSTLMDKAHVWETSYLSITKVCQSCVGRSDHLDCTSLDCPILYRRHQASQQLLQTSYLYQLLHDFLN